MKYIKRIAKAFIYPMFCVTGALAMVWYAVSGKLDDDPIVPEFKIYL